MLLDRRILCILLPKSPTRNPGEFSENPISGLGGQVLLSGPYPSLAFSDIGHEAPWFLIVLLEVDGHTDKFTRDRE